MKSFKKIAALCCVILFFACNSVKAEEENITESMVLDEGIAWNVFTGKNVESVEFKINGKCECVTDWTESDGRKCFAFCEIGPKMLTDELTVTAHFTDGKTKTHKTSGRKYLTGLYGQSDELDSLINNLLGYGTSAQIYENYRTDRLADGSDIENARRKNIAFFGNDIKYIDYDSIYSPNVLFSGTSVVLGDTVSVVLCAKSDIFYGKYINIRIGDISCSAVQQTDISSNESEFKFDINAAQFSSPITAYFTDSYGSIISPTLTYSVESYVTRMCEKTTDENLKNLLSAFALYCKSAENYAKVS